MIKGTSLAGHEFLCVKYINLEMPFNVSTECAGGVKETDNNRNNELLDELGRITESLQQLTEALLIIGDLTHIARKPFHRVISYTKKPLDNKIIERSLGVFFYA